MGAWSSPQGGEMKNASVLRFGGFAAVAVGVLYLLIAATHFMLPRAQLHGAAGIGGAGYLLLFGASLAQIPLLVDISVGLGGTLLAPVWYIGSGIDIVKRAGGAATP